jgi:hypothetical protein
MIMVIGQMINIDKKMMKMMNILGIMHMEIIEIMEMVLVEIAEIAEIADMEIQCKVEPEEEDPEAPEVDKHAKKVEEDLWVVPKEEANLAANQEANLAEVEEANLVANPAEEAEVEIEEASK